MDVEILAFIVVMTMIAAGTWLSFVAIRAQHEERRLKAGSNDEVRALTSDNQELRQQVAFLEDRIAVLERIATDPAERTARQIEQLER